MRLRDPFSGRFTTRAHYTRAQARLVRQRERAFADDDMKRLKRLTDKARRYPPLPVRLRPPKRRRGADALDLYEALDDFAIEWEFGFTYPPE